MSTTPEDDAVNSADTAAQTSDRSAPALRKRHGNGPLFFVLGTIFAVACTIGWGNSVMTYTGLSGDVYHQVVSFSAPSEKEADITVQVNSKNGAECMILALDDQHVEVGQERFTVEGGNRTVTANMETLRQASTVEVTSCREQDSQD